MDGKVHRVRHLRHTRRAVEWIYAGLELGVNWTADSQPFLSSYRSNHQEVYRSDYFDVVFGELLCSIRDFELEKEKT
jgi:hypothetical protein